MDNIAVIHRYTQFMSQLTAFRCPTDVFDFVQSQVSTTGLTKTDVIVGLLRSSTRILPINSRKSFPEISVIYFVWTGETLLYIGKTVNLRNRFKQHHRLSEFLDNDAPVYITWFPTTEENLTAYEDSFLEEFETELNKSTTRKTENLIRLTPEAKQILVDLSTQYGLSLSNTVEKLLLEKFATQTKD